MPISKMVRTRNNAGGRRRVFSLIGALIVSVSLLAAVSWPARSASAATPASASVYAWGLNFYGELGDGTTTQHHSPEAITLAPGVTPTAIASGNDNSLAIGSDGNLYAWGGNGDGDLGDGTTTQHDSPEVITLAPGVTPTAIAAGYLDSMAIGSDGNLYAWGGNEYGQLGDGTTTQHDSPEVITLAPGVTPTAIATSAATSMAIGSDGNLYTWGDNGEGALGDGTTTQHDSPEVITLAPGVTPTAIATSGADSMAIGSDGKLYAWGGNDFGELGDGTTTQHLSPEVITLAPGVTPTAIAEGSWDSMAIGSDGNLYNWGVENGPPGQASPEVITLAPGVTPTAIADGNDDSMAIGSDGKLYAWRDNEYGQLGDGTTTSQDNPEAITLAPGVTPTAIAIGLDYSLAIDPALAALGDSYSSGEGAGDYYPDSGECDRSPNAWAVQLHRLVSGRDVQMPQKDFLACSGATSKALAGGVTGQPNQISELAQLSPAPTLVTMTMGGNDVGFANVLKDCYKKNCIKDGTIEKAEKAITDEGTKLVPDYKALIKADPSATIVIVGYPRIFEQDHYCGPEKLGLGFTVDELIDLNNLGALLNAVIRDAAAQAGVQYVDVTDALQGHELCTKDPWVYDIGINALWNNQDGHPTVPGQNAIAAIVAAYINKL